MKTMKTIKTTLKSKPHLGNVQEVVKFVRKEVNVVEDKLRDEAKAIAIRSGLFGGAIGIVLGIVGTALFQRYVSPPPRT